MSALHQTHNGAPPFPKSLKIKDLYEIKFKLQYRKVK